MMLESVIYNGYRFPFLKAQWAVFFEALGLKYEYGNQIYDLGGVQHSPDFWVEDWQSWVEVKSAYPSQDEKLKGHQLWQLSDKRCLVIWGNPSAKIDRNALAKSEIAYRLEPATWHFLHKHNESWENKRRNIQECASFFTECPSCGKLHYSNFTFDNRCHGGIALGCICEGGTFDLVDPVSPRIIAAYVAVRQARFEQGV